MKKHLAKFERFSSGRKFLILFVFLFIICLPAIPIVMASGQRIYTEWSDIKFVAFAVLAVSAGYAAFLAGFSLFFARFIKKRRS